ncbi:hypothetical protein K440DRAFT_555778 [Wilcoxina mikolae CBS 423.85]|nr:hypothetical protein K440DRAFT_555778 [Wilcoxina mikolae CBS 423.85]
MSSTTTAAAAAATDREVLVAPASPTAGSATSSASPTPAPTPTPTPETTSAATPAPETATDHKAEGDATDGGKKKRYCTHRKCAKEREEKEAAEKAEKEKEKAEKEKEKEKAAEKEDKEKAEKESKKEKKDKKKNKKKKNNKKKSKKRGKGRKDSSDSDSDSSSDESDSDDEETVAGSDSSSDSSDSSSDSSSSDSGFEDDALVVAMRLLLARKSRKKSKKQERKKAKAKKRRKEEKKALKRAFKDAEAKAKEGEGDGSRASVLEYKRVDELFDKELHDWDVRDTVPHSKTDKYSSFIFTVRRIFDYESRYVETLIDVKSTLLKDALSDIMGDIRGVSLVEDVPEVDPNMLFNYYPELTEWVKQASNPKPATEDEDKEKEKKKQQKEKKLDPATGVPHVKLLIEYLDTDYKNTKATLFPLLENKSITFDLLWAVLKPGTIMYTTCAGSDEPRAFKLEYAQMNVSFMRGKWWSIEGRYLEYDGKDNSTVTGKDGKKGGGFGWGSVMVDIEAFKGARKIGSLACYPLEYRKDSEELKAKLIERGKKFVSLRGMQYKSHNGLAFMKKKRQYLKVHVKGRIMIDSVTFRRINPNYIISSVKSRNNEAEEDENANYFHIEDRQEDDEGDESDACSQCCCTERTEEDEEEKQRKAMRFVKDEKGDWHVVTKGEEEDKSMKVETLEQPADDEEEDKEPELEDEDYLIASPVVLGWAFTEKLWLEFPVATVEDITWNDNAFDTLVLPEEQKAIVRALVESHSGSTTPKTIDDFITGKGRGLVCVLHGPPGVGKTLTAEGIAELLRRPLYCVSSGELGTNPAQLEHELQKILDIAQGWGAVLLLDEADVFLERRSSHDLHRNALVSIFLRLLEYFQGILFLTTNRVETFDEAFQSRIHVALRYNDLDRKAKRIIWRTFLSKVSREEPGSEEREIVTSEELDNIARKDLNGRQIKNVVRTSQALANSKREKLELKHLMQVLKFTEEFEHNLKGTGQLDGNYYFPT